MNNDWSLSFAPAGWYWLHGWNPYDVPGNFASPPWSAVVLAPLAWIPPELAMLLPALALLICAYRLRKPSLIPLVGLSFPFLMATAYANIDWMVMLGAVIGGPLGVILNTVKPQAGAFANLALLSRCPTWRRRILLILPLLILIGMTLSLWGDWLDYMRLVGMDTGTVRNFSLFPYSVPVGLLGLYLAWKRQSILWGVVASLSFAPYFYVHSLMPLLLLVSDHDWRAGLIFNLFLWCVLALILAGLLPIQL